MVQLSVLTTILPSTIQDLVNGISSYRYNLLVVENYLIWIDYIV